MISIFIADDDVHILRLVQIQLTRAGYQVATATNGIEALQQLAERPVDLAIVDLMMPGMDGYTLTQKIRLTYDIPIIILTARGQIEDKEIAFSYGADDYIVKPFEPKELLFRIGAVLRRYSKPSEMLIRVGDLTINRSSYEVQIGEQTILMPLKEFEVLATLASRPNQVFTRSDLIEQIWGHDFSGDERTVNVHIKRIRERLHQLTEQIRIMTVRGVGYRLEVRHL